MQKILIFTIAFFTGIQLFGQVEMPKEITPQLLKIINGQVEKEAVDFKNTLKKDDLSADEIAFSVDTFKIGRTASKRIDVDYSTSGMNATVNELTDSYDKLMNKYYNKLLKSLKAEDKISLIEAQRAWINFRDTEAKLIRVMTKPVYSGGGTVQTNIAISAYSDLVIERTIAIFNYFEGIEKGD